MDLNNSDKQDSDNSENEASLDPKAAVVAEENSDDSEGQNLLESEDKVVLGELAVHCQVRADIYSQISIFLINGC